MGTGSDERGAELQSPLSILTIKEQTKTKISQDSQRRRVGNLLQENCAGFLENQRLPTLLFRKCQTTPS